MNVVSRTEAANLAARYSCSLSTVRRLQRRGINVTDPCAVADALLENRSPRLGMLSAVAVAVQSMPPPGNPFIKGWKRGHENL